MTGEIPAWKCHTSMDCTSMDEDMIYSANKYRETDGNKDSGELSGYKFLEWIMLQATERKYIAYKTDVRSGKNIAFVEPEIQKRIKKHLEGKFYLYDNSVVQDEKQTESILKVFEACARRYGCKLYLVDWTY